MKFKLLLLTCFFMLFVACAEPEEIPEHKKSSEDIDFDLTQMSETMVYSQIFALVSNPSEYEDARFIIEGTLYESEDLNTKENFYAVFISDASACCSQGLEVEFDNNRPVIPLPADVVVEGTVKVKTIDDIDYAYILVEEVL